MKIKLKNKPIITIASTLILVIAIIHIQQNYLVIHNKSVSLPNKWFVIAKNQIPQKNQIFAFIAKDSSTYKSDEIFIKIVGGVVGDQVIIKERDFYINDQFIGTAKIKSLKGQPLAMSTAGSIPQNSFFAYTPHKDSYDSRYQEIGLINAQDIIGAAIVAF